MMMGVLQKPPFLLLPRYHPLQLGPYFYGSFRPPDRLDCNVCDQQVGPSPGPLPALLKLTNVVEVREDNPLPPVPPAIHKNSLKYPTVAFTETLWGSDEGPSSLKFPTVPKPGQKFPTIEFTGPIPVEVTSGTPPPNFSNCP